MESVGGNATIDSTKVRKKRKKDGYIFNQRRLTLLGVFRGGRRSMLAQFISFFPLFFPISKKSFNLTKKKSQTATKGVVEQASNSETELKEEGRKDKANSHA